MTSAKLEGDNATKGSDNSADMARTLGSDANPLFADFNKSVAAMREALNSEEANDSLPSC